MITNRSGSFVWKSGKDIEFGNVGVRVKQKTVRKVKELENEEIMETLNVSSNTNVFKRWAYSIQGVNNHNPLAMQKLFFLHQALKYNSTSLKSRGFLCVAHSFWF